MTLRITNDQNRKKGKRPVDQTSDYYKNSNH